MQNNRTPLVLAVGFAAVAGVCAYGSHSALCDRLAIYHRVQRLDARLPVFGLL